MAYGHISNGQRSYVSQIERENSELRQALVRLIEESDKYHCLCTLGKESDNKFRNEIAAAKLLL